MNRPPNIPNTNMAVPSPEDLTPEQRRALQRYGYLRARLVNFLEQEKVDPGTGISLLLDVAMWSAAHCPPEAVEETIAGVHGFLQVFFEQHRARLAEMAAAEVVEPAETENGT
jgi:hypothetical protein